MCVDYLPVKRVSCGRTRCSTLDCAKHEEVTHLINFFAK